MGTSVCVSKIMVMFFFHTDEGVKEWQETFRY